MLDEPVGARVVEPAAEPERVLERLARGARARRRSTRAGSPESVAHRLGAEVASRRVHAERQRQARSRAATTRRGRGTFVDAGVLVRQLALVDEQAGARAARRDLVEDLVERHARDSELAAERDARGRGTRSSAFPGTTISSLRSSSSVELLARDDDRAVAGADARAVREQRVALVHERVRARARSRSPRAALRATTR